MVATQLPLAHVAVLKVPSAVAAMPGPVLLVLHTARPLALFRATSVANEVLARQTASQRRRGCILRAEMVFALQWPVELQLNLEAACFACSRHCSEFSGTMFGVEGMSVKLECQWTIRLVWRAEEEKDVFVIVRWWQVLIH